MNDRPQSQIEYHALQIFIEAERLREAVVEDGGDSELHLDIHVIKAAVERQILSQCRRELERREDSDVP